MLDLLYISTKTVVPVPTPAGLIYIGGWDAFLVQNGSQPAGNRLDKIFRDGSQLKMGDFRYGFQLLSRAGARCFWGANGVCYGADDITGQHQPGDILNPGWTIPGDKRTAAFLDDGRNRYLHCSLAGGVAKLDLYQLSGGALLSQVALPSALQMDSLCEAGEGRVLAGHKASGFVALVNYLGGEVLWQSAVRPFGLAAFDSLHDLVVTLEADNLIRIYLLTAAPADLSNPEIYPPVAQVDRWQGYPVRVRLTGADGEPCAGYRVDWVLPVLGYLQKAHSPTDAQGYADNFYFASEVGEVTLAVQAVV